LDLYPNAKGRSGLCEENRRRQMMALESAIELSTSLRAERSNPEAASKNWIASSQELLAMTG
jgi:hypothetical protein